MNAACSCSEHSFGDWAVATHSMTEELDCLRTLLPSLMSDAKIRADWTEKGLLSHRFRGKLDGLPLEGLQLYSVVGERDSASSQSRRFVGQIGKTMLDYTMYGVARDETEIEITVLFHSRPIESVSKFSYVYDFKRSWVISTTPDITESSPSEPKWHSPARRMILIERGPSGIHAVGAVEYIECVLHIVIHVGGICAWLFVGCAAGPGGCAAIIPAYLACAGPAVAAAIVGCAYI
jgi:hypothetical protein